MNQISAADNHTIQFTPGRWRMSYSDKPLAEASERGFRYGNRFGATRRLPEGGILRPDQLLQVVLGWEGGDESWHLGLVLNPELAEARGSRWIELASWPDPTHIVFEELAKQAGDELANTLGIPLYIAAPQVVEEIIPEPPLPDLPLTAGFWQLEANPLDGSKLLLKRDRTWSRQIIGRAIWYFFWMVVYIFVSGASLTAAIALPNAGTLIPPRVLPYVGLGVALLLLALGINQLLILLREPDQIEIDAETRSIQARRGDKVRWSLASLDVQSIYVSEIIKKRSRNNHTEYSELNLHLGGGKFHLLFHYHDVLENKNFPVPGNPFPRTDPEIEEMTADRISTPLQGIGLHIARTLGVGAWYDLRLQ